MPKYYVSTGRLQMTISRNSPRVAAEAAIARDLSGGGNPVEYGTVTEVNETGHTCNREGVFFSTSALLGRASNTL